MKLHWVGFGFYFQTIFTIRAVENTINDLKLNHVTLIINYPKTDHDYKLDYFYQSIIDHVSTISIDLLSMKQTGDNRTFDINTFRNPRQSTVYIILQGKNMKINDILDKLVSLSPLKMRPKCLIVFADYVDFSQDEAKRTLNYSWDLKFLDFSIFWLKTLDNNTNYINYNPFKETYKIGHLKEKNDLFPDKLVDVNKYPLKLSVFDAAPYLVIKTQSDNNISVDGNTPFVYLKAAVEKLNFKLKFIYNQTWKGNIAFEIVSSVERGDTAMTPLAFHFTDWRLKSEVLMGKVLEMGKYVVIVPILHEYRIDIPFDVFIHVVIFFLVVIIFYVSLRILKIESDLWNIVSLFGILIGVSMSQPGRNTERIIFLTLAFLSFIYTNELLSKLTDIKVLRTELKFESFEDIYASQIPTYYYPYAVTENNSETEEIKKVISNGKKMYDFSNCTKNMIVTRNAICIIPYRDAIYAVKQNFDAEGQPIMKMTDLTLRHEFVGFLYEKASPFAERFNKLMQRMIDFAIFPDREMNRIILHKDSNEKSVNRDDPIIKTTLLILLIGYVSSTIIFIYEIISFTRITQ